MGSWYLLKTMIEGRKQLLSSVLGGHLIELFVERVQVEVDSKKSHSET